MNLFKFINLIAITCLVLFIFNCPNNTGPDEDENGGSPPGTGDNDWAKRLGGTDNDYGFAIKTDSTGSVYTTGYLRSSADFNGDGVLSTAGGELQGWMNNDDIFIVKYNSSGTYQWSKRLGGTGTDRGHDIALDSGNNLYITGYVSYSADLNGDGDSTDEDAESSTGHGQNDIFIVKFDAGGGYQWSWRLGGTLPDQGYGLATDPGNNVFLTGYMAGSANMNGDVTNDIIDLGDGFGSNDIILVKFNSLGKYQWSKRIGGTGYDTGRAVTADSSGNVFVTGLVSGDVDFNGDGDYNEAGEQTFTSIDYADIIIVKFDSAGAYQWSKRLSNNITNCGVTSIASDSGSNVYLAGSIEGNADINGDGDYNDGEAESGTGYDGGDAFIVKFSTTGTYQWSKRLGGANSDCIHGISIDSSNNIFAAGVVNYNADLNGDGDSTDGVYESLTVSCYDDIFITKFNSSGIFQWAKRYFGAQNDCSYSIAANSGNNIYITGYLRGNIDLNGDSDTVDSAESSAGFGVDDIFIIKIAN